MKRLGAPFKPVVIGESQDDHCFMVENLNERYIASVQGWIVLGGLTDLMEPFCSLSPPLGAIEQINGIIVVKGWERDNWDMLSCHRN